MKWGFGGLLLYNVGGDLGYIDEKGERGFTLRRFLSVRCPWEEQGGR